MDLIISPTTVAFNTQPGAPTPAFQAGEVVSALVLQLLENGNVRLSIGNSLLDVQTLVPLVPGTTVQLAVKNTSDGIKLVILNPGAVGAPPGSATDAAAAAARGASTPGAVNTAAGGANGSSVSSADAPEAIAQSEPQAPIATASPAAALAQAVRTAAVLQNGLAPLFADVAEATAPANAAALPQPVQEAMEALLALRPSLDANLSGEDVQQAFLQSGLFLEAGIAAANASAGQPATLAGEETARSAPTPGNALTTPAASALAASLVSAPTEDLKAALTVLRQVLEIWLDTAPATTTDNAPASGRSPLPNLPDAPSLAPQEAADGTEARASTSLAPMPSGPPPPYRGAPTAPQPAAAPSIPVGTDPRLMGERLLAETDAALSRQTLLQAASLPGATSAPMGQPAHSDGPRWNFEVPFATPQGTAIAQFEIARDGNSGAADTVKPVWRARFTIDIEPMGAVHAQVALIGTRAAVTLWAERGESAAKLRQNSSLLSDALRQAELEAGDVVVRDGTPPQPRQAAPAGRFLDRAS